MHDELNDNRLKRALRKRRRWYVSIHLAAVAFIAGAMVLSLPVQASAADFVNTMGGGADGFFTMTVSRPNQGNDANDTGSNLSSGRIPYYFATSSGHADEVQIWMERSGSDPSCPINVSVYSGTGSPAYYHGKRYLGDTLELSMTFQENTIADNTTGSGYTFAANFDVEIGRYYYFIMGAGTLCGSTGHITHGYRTVTAPAQVPIIESAVDVSSVWSLAGDWGGGTNEYMLRISGDVDPPPVVASLTSLLVSNVIQVGDTVPFIAEWEDAPFPPYYLFFYEDANDTEYRQIVQNYPMATPDGSWEFSHTYNVPSYSDQYTPFVQWGNSYCSTPTASGCVLFDASADPISVQTAEEASDDSLFPSTLTGSKLDDVAVNESVNFTYNIDPPCTITGRRFFLGYPGPLAYLDTGVVLATNTGSFAASFPRTAMPYSSFFFPYINVFCDDETSKQLYLGNTWIKGRARGISVFTQEELQRRNDVTTPMLNGGATDDFSNTTGFSFKANKRVFAKYEPVLFELNHHVDFTPTQVLLYPTGTGASAVNFGSGDTALTENKYHRFRYSYSVPGFYHPVVQIRSSDPGVYKNVFLGGNDYPLPYNQIAITSDVWGSITDLFTTDDGIFGLDPATFSISLGSTENEFLQTISGGMNKIISGGLYVAGFAYNILKNSPVLSTVTDVVNPPDGAIYTFPTKLFGYTIIRPANPLCTVDYASDSDFGNIEILLRAVVAAGVASFVIKSFF